MEFGEMKRNTSNWSNFGMLLHRVGLSASAGISSINYTDLNASQKLSSLMCIAKSHGSQTR